MSRDREGRRVVNSLALVNGWSSPREKIKSQTTGERKSRSPQENPGVSWQKVNGKRNEMLRPYEKRMKEDPVVFWGLSRLRERLTQRRERNRCPRSRSRVRSSYRSRIWREKLILRRSSLGFHRGPATIGDRVFSASAVARGWRWRVLNRPQITTNRRAHTARCHYR